MRANLKVQFNIAVIAEHAAVSKRKLEMRFRESLGISPHEYSSRLRVQHAQAMMQLPKNRTITQTATECGFATTRTFYAAFQMRARLELFRTHYAATVATCIPLPKAAAPCRAKSVTLL